MVYFILDVQSRAIKIGYSESPQERLDALQTANPNPLFLCLCRKTCIAKSLKASIIIRGTTIKLQF